MKRFMMVALLLGALSLGACVDDTETQSVTDVRNAKAEQLKAAATLATAQAEAAKAQAEAQKALAEAQAEYQKAQAEAAKIAAEAEAALKKAEAAKAEAEAAVQKAKAEQIAAQTEAEKALAEANLKKALAEAEAAEAAAEQAKIATETAKKQAELAAAQFMAEMEKLKVTTEMEIARMEALIAQYKADVETFNDQHIQRLFTNYTNAVSELNTLKKNLITKQHNLALLESGYTTTEVENEQKIASYEQKIAADEAQIEAYKEYKGYDVAQLKEQADQLKQQYEMAMAEFDTNPVCAAVVATNEPIEKAVNEMNEQAELVDAVRSYQSNIINSERHGYMQYNLYGAVTSKGFIPNGSVVASYYTGVSVNEAGKMAYENRLAHNIEDCAEWLGTPEDRYDMYTAYGYLANAKKNYDEAVANLEKVKGEFSEEIEAYEKAETAYFAAKDVYEAAQAAAVKAREDHSKAVEAANKAAEATAKAQEAADKAAAKVTETSAALAAANALPDTDKDKATKVAAAEAAYEKAKADNTAATEKLTAAKTAQEAADKAAKEAKTAADKAQEAYTKAGEAYSKAGEAYTEAQQNKSAADQAVKDAENAVVNAQNDVSDWTNRLNRAQTAYDNAVKRQQEFAEAFAALDVEAVNAAWAALEEATDARDEAIEAYNEAREPIDQIYNNWQVANQLCNNNSAIDVEAKINELQGDIADQQTLIAIAKENMTNREATIEQSKAEIAELEEQIEIQTGLVEKAKAALDAALAE